MITMRPAGSRTLTRRHGRPCNLVEALESRTLFATLLLGSSDAAGFTFGGNSGGNATDNLRSPSELTQFRGSVVFSMDAGDGGLWRIDAATGDPLLITKSIKQVRDLTVVGDTLFFSAEDFRGRELWRTDGTSAGTNIVADLSQDTFGSSPGELIGFGDSLFFVANDDSHGRQLWRTDGTAQGTQPVGPDQLVRTASVTNVTVAGGQLLFFVTNFDDNHTRLWRSDGTAGGTSLVADFPLTDISHGVVSTSLPGELSAVGPFAYFHAGQLGTELWRTDGTPQGTIRLADTGSLVTGIVGVNGVAYASAARDSAFIIGGKLQNNPGSIWRSHGTAQGTSRGGELDPTLSYGASHLVTALASTALYQAKDPAGAELWRSDAGGTSLVADINPGPGNSYPVFLAVSDGFAYFSADDGIHGRELWVSDGTAGGTRLLADLVPGAQGSGPASVVPAGDALYFTTSSGPHFDDLWKWQNGRAAPVTGLPTASLYQAPVIAPGSAAARFIVKFSSDSLDPSSLVGNDQAVRVRGPNGFDEPATFVDLDAISLHPSDRLVAYDLSAPGGAWDAADAGQYVFSLTDTSARDAFGRVARSADFDAITLTPDDTPPTATLLPPSAPVPGTGSILFSVRYSDDHRLGPSPETATLVVSGPRGFSQTLTPSHVDSASPVDTSRTATYTLTAPGGAWDRADNGAYSVQLPPEVLTDSVGNPASAAGLGSFSVRLKNNAGGRPAGVDLILSLTTSSKAKKGLLGTATVRLTNNGAQDAAVSGDLDLYFSGSEFFTSFPLDFRLRSGASKTFKVPLFVNDSIPKAGSLHAVATLTSEPPEATTANNHAIALWPPHK